MKKLKILFVVVLILLIIGAVFIFLSFKLKPFGSDDQTLSQKEKKQLIGDITEDINQDYNPYDDEKDVKESEKSNKKYDQYFVANGYSGASDNVYYTKDGVLYHLIISTNKIIKVAEGVKKIENGKGTIQVYKGSGFKVFEEDSYLNYVD